MLRISRREENFGSFNEEKINKDFWMKVREACSAGDVELLKFFMRSVDVYVLPKSELTICLEKAINNNHPEMVEFLLSIGRTKYYLPTYLVVLAFKTENSDIVESVINKLKEDGMLLRNAGIMYQLADYLFEHDTNNPDVRKIYLLVRDMWDDIEDPNAVWDEQLREKVLNRKGVGRDDFPVDPINLLRDVMKADWPEAAVSYLNGKSVEQMDIHYLEEFMELLTEHYSEKKIIKFMKSNLSEEQRRNYADAMMRRSYFFLTERVYLDIIDEIRMPDQLDTFLAFLLEGSAVFGCDYCYSYFKSTIKIHRDDIDDSTIKYLFKVVFKFDAESIKDGLITLGNAGLEPVENLYYYAFDKLNEDTDDVAKIFEYLISTYDMYPPDVPGICTVLEYLYLADLSGAIDELVRYIEYMDWEYEVLCELINTGIYTVAYDLFTGYWYDLDLTFEEYIPLIESAYEYGDSKLINYIFSRLDEAEIRQVKQEIFGIYGEEGEI